MKNRLLLFTGIALVVVQTLTVYADEVSTLDGVIMPSSSSSMMSSESSSSSSEVFMDEDASLTGDEFYAPGDKCNCTWIREAVVKGAENEQAARALAINTPPMKPEDVVTSCVRQGQTTTWDCTITRMTSKDSSLKMCTAYATGMQKIYVPKQYKSITCAHVAA